LRRIRQNHPKPAPAPDIIIDERLAEVEEEPYTGAPFDTDLLVQDDERLTDEQRAALYASRTDQQKVLEVMQDHPDTFWWAEAHLLDRAQIRTLSKRGRAKLFGSLRAADLIAFGVKGDPKHTTNYYRYLRSWEATAQKTRRLDTGRPAVDVRWARRGV